MGKIRPSNKSSVDCHEKVLSTSAQPQTPNSNGPVGMTRSSRNLTPGEFDARTDRILSGKTECKRPKPKEKKQRSKLSLTHSYRNGKSHWVSDSDLCSRRMHLKTKKKRKKPEELKEEPEEIVLSKETLTKFSLILEEINKKISVSSWKV